MWTGVPKSLTALDHMKVVHAASISRARLVILMIMRFSQLRRRTQRLMTMASTAW